MGNGQWRRGARNKRLYVVGWAGVVGDLRVVVSNRGWGVGDERQGAEAPRLDSQGEIGLWCGGGIWVARVNRARGGRAQVARAEEERCGTAQRLGLGVRRGRKEKRLMTLMTPFSGPFFRVSILNGGRGLA